MKDILEENGYKIIVAGNGGEALSIIDKQIPDAMILDLMMPGIDGFQVLKTIREHERTLHIPVLILTAKHITKDELKFLKSNNIYQLIQKGKVNREDMLKSVSDMVNAGLDKTVKAKTTIKRTEAKPVILVVEDNPDNMLTIKALLGENYEVIEATDGNESIEIIKIIKPHLILMDIGLPDKDGIELFKEIRRKPELQHIPVIAVTASAMTEDRERILAYGFDGYVPKPIEEKLLYKAIDEVLYGK